MPEEIRNALKSEEDHSLFSDLQCVRSIKKYFENDSWINIVYDWSSIRLNYLKNKISHNEYNFASLFSGLMSSNLVYIKDEVLVFAITEEYINHRLVIKDQNKELWDELCSKSPPEIRDLINHNNKNCSLIYVTLK